VGEADAEAGAEGEAVTVTVSGPALRSAVDVKPSAVQPCCVMTVVP
jgi:DNA-binding protein YbaB